MKQHEIGIYINFTQYETCEDVGKMYKCIIDNFLFAFCNITMFSWYEHLYELVYGGTATSTPKVSNSAWNVMKWNLKISPI